MVAGDDQSIYSWRGADIKNILAFEKDYGGSSCSCLEQTTAQLGHIFAAANAVVAHNSHRKPAPPMRETARKSRYQASDDVMRAHGSEI